MDKITETVTKILKEEEDVLALFLFGSRARDEGRKGSDYDFYAILDRNAKDSLREDEIHKKVLKAAKRYRSEIHLTFQYLFIANEDKSLILKISSEGRLLFSKTYLIAPYRQLGLQKYFICRWGVDERKYAGGSKKEMVRNSRLLISRMLYGYVQKYAYKGKPKESRKEGIIDNKTLFGEGEIIMIPDTMFSHIKYFIEKNRGEMAVMRILNSCYFPSESIEGAEAYQWKKELERLMQLKDKKDKNPFITSIAPFESDKICVKYEYPQENRRQNTIIRIKELPPEMQESIITKRKHEFA